MSSFSKVAFPQSMGKVTSKSLGFLYYLSHNSTDKDCLYLYSFWALKLVYLSIVAMST